MKIKDNAVFVNKNLMEVITMTKKEAVENHRKMWRLIAEETLKRKRKVFKNEYLSLYNIQDIVDECFCCEYASQITNEVCSMCPIIWPGGSCHGENGLYATFSRARTFKQHAELAHIISVLPERETTVFDIMEDDSND